MTKKTTANRVNHTKKSSIKKQDRIRFTPRFLKATMILFFTLAAISTIPLISGISNSVLQNQLSKDAKNARVQLEHNGDVNRQAKIDLLLKSGLFDSGSAILSEKVDTCVLSGEGSGWVYNNWRQYCSFVYVDYLPTNHSKEELVSQLAVAPGIRGVFGTPDVSKNTKNCRIFASQDASTLSYFASTETSEDCIKLKKSTNGNEGDIVPAPHGESFIHKSFNENDINQTEAYVRVETRDDYYQSQQLGCKGLMCGPSIEKAASGF